MRSARINLPLSAALVLGAVALTAGAASAADFDDSGAVGPNLLFMGDLWGGYVAMDDNGNLGGDDPVDTGRIGASLRVGIPLGSMLPGLGLQLDGDFEFDTHNETRGGTTDDYGGAFGIGGHVTWRDASSTFAFGALGAYQETDVKSDENENGFVVGGEAQVNFGSSLVFVQGGYFESSQRDTETLKDAFFVRGGGSYFFGPDMMASADVLFGDGDNNDTPPGSIEFVSWGASFRQQLPDMAVPFSWFVAYDGHYMSQEDPGGVTDRVTEHVFSVGLSFAFGGDNLQNTYQDRIMPGIPLDMIRTAGYTVDVID